jgi:hypothetical protein
MRRRVSTGCTTLHSADVSRSRRHTDRGTVGTAYDAVGIGLDAHDLVVTGNVECGARHTDPSIHQDIVQALSGSRITFVDFTSGDPSSGRWSAGAPAGDGT